MKFSKGAINLMPQPLQASRLHRLYLARARQMVLVLVLALTLVSAAHGGAWWWLREQLKAAATSTASDAATGSPVADVAQLNSFLQQFQQRRDETVVWTPLLVDMFSAIPPGVRLMTIEGSASSRALTLTGTAVERASITTWQRSLGDIAWVDKLTAPLSNLSIGGVNAFTFVLSMQADL